jgi:glycerol uptake facilitator-like aquaporin
VVGTLAAHLTFGASALAISNTARLSWGTAVSELIGTFTLVLVIFGLVSMGRSEAVPMAAEAWVAVMIFSTSSAGFLNPAVTIARSATDTYTGIAPADVPGFMVAQLIGALTALNVIKRWFLKQKGVPASEVVPVSTSDSGS